ncbi:MAG: hypothetical protein R3B81_11920 [bacterium]
MTGFESLWLPIVLSAVFVFVLSSIIHMGPFWHRSDYPGVPDEDRLRDAVRPLMPPPGDYMVPRASSGAELNTPEFMDKMKQGPVFLLTVLPNGAWSMGRNLALWFVYLLVVSFFSAYVAGRALPPGTHYLNVFRFAGATAFIGYAVSLWQMSIWYRRAWSLTFKPRWTASSTPSSSPARSGGSGRARRTKGGRRVGGNPRTSSPVLGPLRPGGVGLCRPSRAARRWGVE